MTVHVFAQAIPQAVLAAVRQDALALAECSNLWVPKERICQSPCRCSSPAELAVCLLYQHVAHLLPHDWQGAEYWVQVYKPGVGLGFHFDKDEHLLKLSGEMVHPAWSSVLYLTGNLGRRSKSNNSTITSRAAHGSTDSCPAQQQPADPQQLEVTSSVDISKGADAIAAASVQALRELDTTARLEAFGANDDWDGCRQAPTVILEQRFDRDLNSPVPLNPNSSTLVWPLKGNYCVFDGQLGHGVLDSCSTSVRATLLVNWWASCPKGVQELQDVSIKQHCLTHLDSHRINHMLLQQHSSCGGLHAKLAPDSSTVSQAAEDGCGPVCAPSPGSCLVQDDALGQTTSRVPPRPGSPACNVAAGGQCHEQQQQQQQLLRVAIPQVFLPLEGSDGSDMLLVDDVLSHNRLPLVGTDATSAVHFVHPGYTLCPIEAPHTQQQVELQPHQQHVQVECSLQQGPEPSTSHVSSSCREACQIHQNECLKGDGPGTSRGGGCEGWLQTLGAFVLTDALGSEGSDSDPGEADSSSEH